MGAQVVDRVEVEGLRELRARLNEAGEGFEKALPTAHRSIAQIVADAAADRVERVTKHPTGRLEATIRGLGSQRDATVKGGSARVPYFGFIDFGGVLEPRGVPIERNFIREGRILYPAFAEKREDVRGAIEDSVNDVLRRARLAGLD